MTNIATDETGSWSPNPDVRVRAPTDGATKHIAAIDWNARCRATDDIGDYSYNRLAAGCRS